MSQATAKKTTILFDEDGNPVQVRYDGERYLASGDDHARSLLEQILYELRILNMHVAEMTEEEPTTGDIEC